MKLQYTYTIIFETENLGMADLEDLDASLGSLAMQTYPIEQVASVIVIAAGQISDDVVSYIKKSYPWITIHRESNILEYTESKKLGAIIATSDIVIYADVDVVYTPTWLHSIIKVFETHADADVVSGDTRIQIRSAYAFSLSVMWMIHMSPRISDIERTNQFRLNNFAIRRQIMLDVPFISVYPTYRGKIKLWRNELLRREYIFYRAPYALAYHATPTLFWDWWYRMLIFGRDFVAQADFVIGDDGQLVEQPSCKRRIWRLGLWCVYRYKHAIMYSKIIVDESPNVWKYVPIGIVWTVINISVTVLGGIIACIHRDYLLHKIVQRERRHIV